MLTAYLAKRQLEQFADHSRGDFRYQLIKTTSNLLQVELTLADVSLQLPNGTKITCPQLSLMLPIGRWHNYHLASQRKVTIALANTNQNNDNLITAQSFTGELRLHQPHRWHDVKAELQQVAWHKANDETAMASTANAQLLLQQPAETPSDHRISGLAMALAANDITLRSGLFKFLPQRLTALTLNARIMGASPDWRQQQDVTVWRDSGGTIELDGLDFGWHGLNGKVQGSMSLDSQLQPQGAGTIQLMRNSNTIASDLPPIIANGLDLAFGLMAKTDINTGVKSVTLPISAQNRQLRVGMFDAGTTPELMWFSK